MLLRNSGDMKQVQWNIVENHDEDQGQIVYNKIRPNVHNSQGTGCHRRKVCVCVLGCKFVNVYLLCALTGGRNTTWNKVVLSRRGILWVSCLCNRSIDYNESMTEVASLIKTSYFGPVCFRFFGCRFSENQDSEIIQLSGKSAVWINWVFDNPNYLVPILWIEW